MPPKPMEGIRVLEVAQFTFVPAAGAVLADWGADVIKVEHPETGDAQRGLVKVLGLDTVVKGSSFVPIMEGPNRGKRSIGLALDKPEAMSVLHELVSASDVFLTNFLPRARAKLGIDVADIQAVNPDIIYMLGSGFGYTGPESDKGGYDSTAYWARGGSGDAVTPPGSDAFIGMPTGAYGDSIGGMTIAGGVAAALFARGQTGQPSVVDVSLLGVGAWATQFNTNLSLMAGGPLPKVVAPKHGSASNPLAAAYRTADDRWLMLTMLQPGRYWPEFCRAVGREELATDERFDSARRSWPTRWRPAKLSRTSSPDGRKTSGCRPLPEWKVSGPLSRTTGRWATIRRCGHSARSARSRMRRACRVDWWEARCSSTGLRRS